MLNEVTEPPGQGVEFEVAMLPDDDGCVCGEAGDLEPCACTCACDWGLSCAVPAAGGAAGDSRCVISCSNDADCVPGYACERNPGGYWGVCVPTFTGPTYVECDLDADCATSERRLYRLAADGSTVKRVRGFGGGVETMGIGDGLVCPRRQSASGGVF